MLFRSQRQSPRETFQEPCAVGMGADRDESIRAADPKYLGDGNMSALSQAQLQHFEEEGFLIVEDLMPTELLDELIVEYGGVLDTLADELYAAGEISSTYHDLPFGERITAVYRDSGRTHAQYFDFTLPGAATKADTPFWTGPAVFQALTEPHILDVVESLIGPEIYSNPVQHVRIKPPEDQTLSGEAHTGALSAATPWHQDNGVVLPEADDTNMLTVWFSLLDAPVESGCLQIIPRSHRRELLVHCTGVQGVHLPDPLLELESAIPVPMCRGDVLFLHKHTCHGSLSNVSDRIRWSFDIRYNPSDQPTGRGFLPGFVARSRAAPETELRSAEEWTRLWLETRERLAAMDTDDTGFYRWDGKAGVCA